MISWIKSLFKKTPPDISEPVISFVELVKNNPDRFRLNLDNCANREYFREHYNPYYKFYSLYDRKLNEYSVLFMLEEYVPDYTYYLTMKKHSYLTPDEYEYIHKRLRSIFQAREDKLILIKSQRKVRNDQRKRERDIKKYCKE